MRKLLQYVGRNSRRGWRKPSFVGAAAPSSQRGVPAVQGLGQRLLALLLPGAFLHYYRPRGSSALEAPGLPAPATGKGGHRQSWARNSASSCRTLLSQLNIWEIDSKQEFKKIYRNTIISFWHFQGSWQESISSVSHRPVSSFKDGPSHFTHNEEQLQGTTWCLPESPSELCAGRSVNRVQGLLAWNSVQDWSWILGSDSCLVACKTLAGELRSILSRHMLTS